MREEIIPEQPDDFRQWLGKMARWCAYRERCESEVREKLESSGCEEELVEKLLEELREQKFLDDARFAESYARGKFRIKSWGKLKIRYELKLLGISSSLIEKGIEKGIPDSEYSVTAEKLARKKLAGLNKETPLKRKQKLIQFMTQRGFENEVIRNILSGK